MVGGGALMLAPPALGAERSRACQQVQDFGATNVGPTSDFSFLGDFHEGETLTIIVGNVVLGTPTGVSLQMPAGTTVGSTATIPGGVITYVIPDATPAPAPAWVQSYGRFGADAPCLEGWGPSWQAWAEPITGGWVCTRSIPSFG